ncbi:hypothetical protein Syun_018490 [Stephania yunnanensis]|uniref:Protein kinase domain-containing protein n=1 Tax=Stephania yunnanensis TaxID=152371 RepID=A0AAP0ITV3_9MAGN
MSTKAEHEMLEELGNDFYGKVIHDYELLECLGEGSFGRVWKAVDKQTGDVLAIKELKKFKCCSWKKCLILREVKALRGLDHPNIVKLKQLIVENNKLYLVMECMDMALSHQLVKMRGKKLNGDQVRVVAIQLFQALAHMHGRGYFHRDLKPSNILVSTDVVKVADLGMSREVSDDGMLSDYVTTMWYRAPEVLLMAETYGPEVDMWAMGAIMAELFTSTPLFRGSNSVDQVWKICSVIGTPTKDTWEDGHGLSHAGNIMKLLFPKAYDCVDKLAESVPNADENAISLIPWLCSWDGRKRPTALEALRHPFFASHYTVPKSIVTRGPTSPVASSGTKRKASSIRGNELHSH